MKSLFWGVHFGRQMSSGWLGALMLMFLVTAIFSLGNADLPLIDRDEPRFAEASREMMERGEWVVPSFNEVPRYDKPPLIYWMQIVCYRCLGAGEFAARFPSVFCTAAIAVILLLWGRRLGGDLCGWVAAVTYCLCLQVLIHGRASVADGPLVLFCTIAAWSGWEWVRHPRFMPFAAFWISMALGFLAKGPVAWIPVGMVGLLAYRSRRRGGTVPSGYSWILGGLLMTSLVALWGVPALSATRGDYALIGLGKHVIGRSMMPMEGHGARGLIGYLATLPFYFLSVFLSFFPWSIWIPALLRFFRRGLSEESRYLVSGVALVFSVFTLSWTKLPHYTLPSFPFLSLLLGMWWVREGSLKLFIRVGCIAVVGFILLPLIGFRWLKDVSVSENLVGAVREHLDSETAVALVDFKEPSLVWLLRGRIPRHIEIIRENEVNQWLAREGKGVCILTSHVADRVSGAGKRIESAGINFAKGRSVKLVAMFR
jgi:4-amino-4-deoxy-L-arabinose transferase-like glycosyltransferase